MKNDESIRQQVFEFFRDNTDPELIDALYNPTIINSSNDSLQQLSGSMSLPLLICDNPDSNLPNVPKQLNFIVPLALKNSKESYAINLKNDLNMYRKTYEKYAKQVNELIDKTKSSLKKFYKPVKKLRKEIKNYSENYHTSIMELCIPLKNKKDGLNIIDFSKYPNDKQKKFLNDKNEIIQEINEFIKEAHKFCENYEKLNKNTLEETELFVQQFVNLSNPAKELSDFMTEIFKAFEKSSSQFDDINDKEKISKELQKLKKPMNEFQKRSENIMDLLKPVEDFEKNEKKLDNINEILSKIKNSLDTLKEKSKIILKKVEKIREKYGEEKIVMSEMKAVPPNKLDISKCKEELKKEQEDINKKAEEGINEIKNGLEQIQRQSRLDLLFILDITNSMNLYLEESKNKILDMMKIIEANCPGIEINLGFIGYRDFNDLDFGEQYINLEFTTHYENIKNSIKDLTAEGGGDIPEDLCGALELAQNKKWGGNTKFAVLVTDSPCHGKKYHDLEDDNYPNGDRNGRAIEKFIEFFAKNKISLFCLKINNTTNKMFNIFKEIYEKNKPDNSNASLVYQEGKQLLEFVTNNAIKIFQNRDVLEIK